MKRCGTVRTHYAHLTGNVNIALLCVKLYLKNYDANNKHTKAP